MEPRDPWNELELGETQWHDGQLLRLEVRLSEKDEEMVVTLEVDIYEDMVHAPDRHRLIVTFTNVREFAMVGSAAEMLSNMGGGHISNARLSGTWPNPFSKRPKKYPAPDLSVTLTGGYFRIRADACEVRKPRRGKRKS